MYYLVIHHPGQVARRVPLHEGTIRIGRSPDNDILLEERDVSRYHVELVVAAGSVHLRDLQSINGAIVNADRVESRNLEEGDVVRLGKTRLTLRRTLGEDLSTAHDEPPSRTPEVSEDPRVDLRSSLVHLNPSGCDATLDGVDTDPKTGLGSAMGRLGAIATDLSGDVSAAALPDTLLRAAVTYLGGTAGEYFSLENEKLTVQAACGDEVPTVEEQHLRKAIRDKELIHLKPDGTARSGGTWVLPLWDRHVPLGALTIECTLAGFDRETDTLLGLRVLTGFLGTLARVDRLQRDLDDDRQRMRSERDFLRDAGIPADDGAGLIAEDDAMRQLLRRVDIVAASDSTVLVRGETGTGKELISRRIHDRSFRRDGPFIPVNCGAIPPTLLESTLFGIERGAATGVAGSKGVFELAHEGTLFLDEVGELPLDVQAKFLRSLEEKEVRPIGARSARPADVRIVAATNRNLKEMVKQGGFREDLFYRLRVVELLIPPLRSRPDDVIALARHFIQHFAKRDRKRILGVTVNAAEILRGYSWPGNVRELRNVIERAVVLCQEELLSVDSLPQELVTGYVSSVNNGPGIGLLAPPWREARELFEKAYFQNVFDECHGRVSEIAKRTGINRRNVYEKLTKFTLPPQRLEH